MKIIYDANDQIESINGFKIETGKHAFQCGYCGAIFQSDNFESIIFETEDPKCLKCDHGRYKENIDIDKLEKNFIQVCKC